MRQKNRKYIIVAMLVVFAAVLGIRQTHFQSVDSYRQEQRQLARDVGSDVAEVPVSAYDTLDPDGTDTSDGSFSGSDGQKKQNSSLKNDGEKKKNKTDRTDVSQKTAKPAVAQGTKGSTEKKSSSHAKSSGAGGDSSQASHSSQVNKKPSGKKPAAQKKPSATADTSGSAATNTPDSSGEDQKTSVTGGNTSVPTEGPDNSKDTSSAATSKPQAEQITCSIEISCESLAADKKQAQESIWKYIPSNGMILEKVSVKVDKGASVYDVLEKACKAKGVALDATYTPMYKTYYIQGIGNIYEKQAGDMSGWIYKVNGVSPNRGASVYKVSDGDVISWRYTCDGKTS